MSLNPIPSHPLSGYRRFFRGEALVGVPGVVLFVPMAVVLPPPTPASAP